MPKTTVVETPSVENPTVTLGGQVDPKAAFENLVSLMAKQLGIPESAAREMLKANENKANRINKEKVQAEFATVTKELSEAIAALDKLSTYWDKVNPKGLVLRITRGTDGKFLVSMRDRQVTVTGSTGKRGEQYTATKGDKTLTGSIGNILTQIGATKMGIDAGIAYLTKQGYVVAKVEAAQETAQEGTK
jgi:hypothetical protein